MSKHSQGTIKDLGCPFQAKVQTLISKILWHVQVQFRIAIVLFLKMKGLKPLTDLKLDMKRKDELYKWQLFFKISGSRILLRLYTV